MQPSQLLDLVKTATGLETDYKVMKKYSFSSAGVSAWRTNRAFPKNDVLIRFAEILDVNAGLLMLYGLTWREKNEKAKAELNALINAIANANFDDSFIEKAEGKAVDMEKISYGNIKYSVVNHTLSGMW
ncbi:hypothetical protein [Shewanella maritima]|uniref:hypothetical protein n=1 Tax=Shewanella maritima TaxID=2520507 RepID=UPI0037356757